MELWWEEAHGKPVHKLSQSVCGLLMPNPLKLCSLYDNVMITTREQKMRKGLDTTQLDRYFVFCFLVEYYYLLLIC